jgi:hypothetical protein
VNGIPPRGAKSGDYSSYVGVGAAASGRFFSHSSVKVMRKHRQGIQDAFPPRVQTGSIPIERSLAGSRGRPAFFEAEGKRPKPIDELIRALPDVLSVRRIDPNDPLGIRAPSPGTVEDGYRFNGGDPADKKNWEQVK